MSGKTEIPCFFDQKVSNMSKLSGLPLDMELKIRNNKIEREDIVFGRYKTVMIPIGDHISKDALSELVQYFLINSTLKKVYDQEKKLKSNFYKNEGFPYKCIGL